MFWEYQEDIYDLQNNYKIKIEKMEQYDNTGDSEI